MVLNDSNNISPCRSESAGAQLIMVFPAPAPAGVCLQILNKNENDSWKSKFEFFDAFYSRMIGDKDLHWWWVDLLC
jgi:hypothetical protein